jgi:Flp pilus assembly protein TadD
MDSTVLAHLDSGTSAYREGSLEEAGRHYRAAAEADPELAAAWFGIYMVENALGDAEAADSALQKARSLAPGASIIHPTAADTGGS